MTRLALIACLVLAGCGGTSTGTPTDPGSRSCDPRNQPAPPADAPAAVTPPQVDLVPFASGLTDPIGIVNACDGSGRLFILEKAGAIRIVEQDGTLVERPFLDLTDRIAMRGESGLLGLAFDPDFATSRRFFVYYTNLQFDSVIAEFRASADDPGVADTGVEITHLTIDQPDIDHKGGQLAFGPDGFLYIGLGDGGGAFDEYGNGQNLDSHLSKVLRIDVSSTPYRIPADNPYADGGGVAETWLWGLRNPWRFSFDQLTGELYVADVGQGTWEEVNRVSAGDGGGNFGWPTMEGTNCRLEDDGACDGMDLVLPTFAYEQEPGCAVVGGHVYRGGHPDLWGVYLFTDFCSGLIHAFDASAETPEPVLVADTGRILTTFGVDEANELYVADYVGGQILRVRPVAS